MGDRNLTKNMIKTIENVPGKDESVEKYEENPVKQKGIKKKKKKRRESE